MESRTHYGEYSLRQWLKLLLNRNIILPEYQRSFVWSENNARRLLKSFKDKQFIQPVTIAHYSDGKRSVNLLIDGQQRLTSILLAYLGYFPDKSKFENIEELTTSDDSDEEDNSVAKIIGWTFEKILSENIYDNTKEEIRKKLSKDIKYIKTDFKVDMEKLLDESYLGFSFIIPQTEDPTATQEFFSTLFRNINYLGSKLSPLESRRSLYYLNPNLKNYFDGKILIGKENTKKECDVLCNLRISEKLSIGKIDILRYTSTLHQYYATGENENKVMVGYSSYSSRESYYVDYVSFLLGLEQEDREDKFKGIDFNNEIPPELRELRFRKIYDTISKLIPLINFHKNNTVFTSWIDADYWLFGLIYYILFRDRDINLAPELISEIKAKINNIRKNDEVYVKNTNRLGNLRKRIVESINIYGKYVN